MNRKDRREEMGGLESILTVTAMWLALLAALGTLGYGLPTPYIDAEQGEWAALALGNGFVKGAPATK